MVNGVTAAQAILDAQLVINLRDALIQLLRDVACEYDLAGSTHRGYELQYVYRRRVESAYRNDVQSQRVVGRGARRVADASVLHGGVAGAGQPGVLKKDFVRPAEEAGKVPVALGDGGRKIRNVVRPFPNPRPFPAQEEERLLRPS